LQEGLLHVFIAFEHKNFVQTNHPNPPESLGPMT